MRIQRKRTKGWKMPENTVYVGRPSKWGNPFIIGINSINRSLYLYLYESWLRDKLRLDPTFLDYLKGKDLACWCPLNKPCHADVIIKILNENEESCEDEKEGKDFADHISEQTKHRITGSLIYKKEEV